MDTINCIQKAVDFIEDNLCDELSTETIASQAYMSSFHFQRLFSIVCGVSIGEYIRSRRATNKRGGKHRVLSSSLYVHTAMPAEA